MHLFLYFKIVCKKCLDADLNGIVTSAPNLLYFHQFDYVFYSISHEKQYLSVQ